MKHLLAGALVVFVLSDLSAQSMETEDKGDDAVSTEDLEVAAEQDEIEPRIAAIGPSRVTWSTSARYEFEQKAGYTAVDSTGFHGPPLAFRSRVRARLGKHISAQLTIDHDAGEATRSLDGLFDFVSASLSFSQIGPLLSLAVGAIRPRFGLGLSLWSGQRMTRLETTPSSLMHPGAAIRASASAMEAQTLQGIGGEFALTSSLRILAFIAKTTWDAVLDESGAAISLPTTGLHRNDVEIARNDRLSGRMTGGAILHESRSFSAGVFLGAASTDAPIAVSKRPYRLHSFEGTNWHAGSVFARATVAKDLHLAGEIAIDDDGDPAGVLLVRGSAGRGLWVYTSWRDYPTRFNSVYGSPPGASGPTSGNERGLIIGLERKQGNDRFRLFRDLYRKPWLQSDSYRPAIFSAWGIEVETHRDPIDVLLRYDARIKNRELDSPFSGVAPFQKRSRLRVRLETSGDYFLQPRLDLVFVWSRQKDAETGEAIAQQLVWTENKRLTMTGGVVFYRSDSGNSGVYLYQPGLPDYFSVPLLSGSGQQAYLILTIRASRAATCWIKGAMTRFEEERTLGSGVDKLTAIQQRSLSTAVRFSF